MTAPLFTAEEAARAAEGALLAGTGLGASLTGVAADSRQVGPGDLFVAIRGERVDGHDFVPTAAQRGAAGVLVSRVDPAWGLPPQVAVIQVDDPVRALGRLARYHRRRLPVRLTAITGSVGKTSTKDLTAAVLARRFRLLKSEGNLNTEVGLPLTLLRLTAETEAAVVEMGMRGLGQIQYLASLAEPQVGLITNIGRTHLELLGSEENIAWAKSELLEALPAEGLAILNDDDPWTPVVSGRSRARVLRYGWERVAAGDFPPAGSRPDVYAAGVRALGARGTSFRLFTPEGWAEVVLPLPGRHNVANALAAAAVGTAWGLSPADIAAGLGEARISDKRMNVFQAGAVTILDDTYNASPVSTIAALEVLKGLEGRRRVAVLGNMLELGEYAEEGHREVGLAAVRLGVDVLLTVGDLARHIAAGAQEAQEAQGPQGSQGPQARRAHTDVHHAPDRHAAEPLLAELVRPGDVVLVKGSRGMAMEELVAVLRRRFEAPGAGGSAGEGVGS